MKKQGFIRLLATFMVVIMMLTTLFACAKSQGAQGEQGPQGQQGLPGKDGKDGVSPTIAISEDGYWIINGVKTEHKAIGADGKDGLDGAVGRDGHDGVDGVTPTIEISDDGYWVINGVKTEYRAGDNCEHNYVDFYVLDSTCVSYKVLKVCEICGELTVVDGDPIVSHNYEDGYCTVCGKVGSKYTRDGDYIYFGEYPQTIKADNVTVTSTTDSRGYYLGSDGFYYSKVTATPYGSDFTFSTGATVTSGEVYYFKVEPIRWRILSTDGETALILCDSIIAKMAYQPDYYESGDNYYTTANGAPSGTYANNYKYSEVRRWLNDNFYNTAFSELQRELILTTEVDNSAKSTNPHETLWNNGVNDYACENTSDKIFLLSTEEATDGAYGFSASNGFETVRRMLTSDYSRATGAYMSTSALYYGNGRWWLRSPNYLHSYIAREVDYDGLANNTYHGYYGNRGVVPALRIKL